MEPLFAFPVPPRTTALFATDRSSASCGKLALQSRRRCSLTAVGDLPVSGSKWEAQPVSEVPSWMIKKGLTGGYRPPNLPWSTICLSAFRLHNETVNIWSHFLAGLAAVALAVRHIPTFTPTPPPTALLFLRAYPLAAAATFFTSTIYHLFQCRSQRVNKILRSCDFQTILLLVTASYLPALNLAYAANPVFQTIYLRLVFAVYPLASIGVAVTGATGQMAIKNALIVFTAFWGIVPTLQTLTAASLVPAPAFFVKSTALMWALYAFGGLIYGLKAPERFMKNIKPTNTGINVFGSSHQWWHLFTIVAALSWYVFLQKYYSVVVLASIPLR